MPFTRINDRKEPIYSVWSNSDPSAPRQWARRVGRLYERTQMQVDYVTVGAGSAGCVLAVRGP
jgi:hypothetical protein